MYMCIYIYIWVVVKIMIPVWVPNIVRLWRVPFLATLNNRCRTILGTQKGIIILTTTHIYIYTYIYIYIYVIYWNCGFALASLGHLQVGPCWAFLNRRERAFLQGMSLWKEMLSRPPSGPFFPFCSPRFLRTLPNTKKGAVFIPGLPGILEWPWVLSPPFPNH